jgi:large subunit ribosomal protein L18
MAQAQTAAPERKPVGQTASAARRVSRLRRHSRLRKKIAGTAERPRLVVNRSSRHIHVQLVNDDTGTTSPPRRPSRPTCARSRVTRRPAACGSDS